MRKIYLSIGLFIIIASAVGLRNRNSGQYQELPVSEAVNQSSELIKAGNQQEAIILLEENIKTNPKNEMLHYNLGVALMNDKNYSEAIIKFSKSIEIKPTLGALNNRAYCYTVMKDVEKAIGDYTKIVQIKNSFGSAYLKRGQLYLTLGKKDAAKADFEKASALGIPQADALMEVLK